MNSSGDTTDGAPSRGYRRPRACLALPCVLVAVFGVPPGTFAGSRVRIWSDEFGGPSLDTSKWEHEVNGHGGGNEELQYYTDRPVNSRIEDGTLVIEAHEETFSGADGTRYYTSARLRTRGKGDWRYGRFDIRAKLPEGRGLWPAIWMLPTDWAYGGWAASGEIDIMELLGHDPARVYGTLHYGGEWPGNSHSGGAFTLPGGKFSDDFHVFSLEWEPAEFRWYVDGVHYLTQTSWYTDAAPYPAPFDQPFHMLLNVAVGGTWPGNPDETTVFPQRMTVDYVRVFKRASTWGWPFEIFASGPSRLEAEDFNTGGQGIAYFDSGVGNNGGAYRTDEDVDIESSLDEDSSFSVGWIESGEWLRYPIDVKTDGFYETRARVASAPGGGRFRVEIEGACLLWAFDVDATGGWHEWRTLEHPALWMPHGASTLRIEAISGGFNLNWLEFRPGSGPGIDVLELW